MHVEAILWSCLAMRMGGGYLDPDRWHCWANTQWKRILKKAGASPARMMSAEDFRSCLAFHAGGTAKTWLAARGVGELLRQLASLSGGKPLGAPTVRPFVPFTNEKFEWLWKRGKILEAAKYYKLVGGDSAGMTGVPFQRSREFCHQTRKLFSWKFRNPSSIRPTQFHRHITMIVGDREILTDFITTSCKR